MKIKADDHASYWMNPAGVKHIASYDASLAGRFGFGAVNEIAKDQPYYGPHDTSDWIYEFSSRKVRRK